MTNTAKCGALWSRVAGISKDGRAFKDYSNYAVYEILQSQSAVACAIRILVVKQEVIKLQKILIN